LWKRTVRQSNRARFELFPCGSILCAPLVETISTEGDAVANVAFVAPIVIVTEVVIVTVFVVVVEDDTVVESARGKIAFEYCIFMNASNDCVAGENLEAKRLGTEV
jgi:hypothetical protein